MDQVVNVHSEAWVIVSRIYRDLFRWLVVPKSRLYRWVFGEGPEGMRRCGELVLSDLAEFCHADKPTIFDTDPLVMARREGRREVFVRIQNFLNLDENAVRKVMEIDDGY
ncbi:hypothetical protein [Novosphingobium sp. BL-52-GroH]|uniref:Bbp19 family protein n=1 Tax=Novosphingobium sp. BL-52-GroH TaxID=3349877 RepID=UPI00384E56FA